MEPFEDLWNAAARRRRVSAPLAGLVEQVYRELYNGRDDLKPLHQALDALVVFLNDPSGRTDANCCATDAFFSMLEQRERNWQHLPPQFAAVFHKLAGALHETIYAPHIAANFESLPEQILQRVRELDPP